MVFQNIDFHNVEELELTEKGYRMWRLPKEVRDRINERAAQSTSWHCSGIELRFKMKSDAVTLFLASEAEAEASCASIYFGSFQGGWEYSTKTIGREKTAIEIRRPSNPERLLELTREQDLPFSPEVVRLVLPYGHCYFAGVEGEVEPPALEDLPKKTYLAYGSSITHGSLALMAPYTYPFRISQKLGHDYINLGLAGTAQLEPAMAEYIVSRKDWDFASVELGVNMLGTFTDEEFEKRVDSFTTILAKDPRPVFATSIFVMNNHEEEKAERFRRIVEKYAKERLIFTPGQELLGNRAFISADGVHPTLEGMEEIVGHWYKVMAAILRL